MLAENRTARRETATPDRTRNKSRTNSLQRYCYDFKAVARAALPYSLDICRRLLPDGKIVARGKEYVARNPTRADRRAGSLSVNLRTGCWADFAADAKGGDLISLLAYVRGVS